MKIKNSEEFLSQILRSKLTPEELEIIDGYQHGSASTLKEKVNDAAMRMIEARQNRNLSDGGNIYIAAHKMVGNGIIQANGGDSALGERPGKAENITLISQSIEGNPTIEARGGKSYASKETPWYKKWWVRLIQIISLVAAIATILTAMPIIFRILGIQFPSS